MCSSLPSELVFRSAEYRGARCFRKVPRTSRPSYARSMIGHERFEKLVAEALDSLPRWVLERLENVGVLVEDHPPRDEPNLLGRYHGVPLTKRSNYWGAPPDTITLYRSTIERSARDEEELRRLVVHTVQHEVAHFFGISDERLRDMGAY